MGLKDYVVPSTEVTLVPTPTTVMVRGLNFADLTALLNEHGPVLILLYGRVMAEANAGTLTADRVGELIQTSLIEMPALMASIIARAVGEPEETELAGKLAVGVQIEILAATIGHTFVSEAEVKKLVETVTTMLEKAGGLATEMTLPSQDGSGASAAA